MKKLVACFFLLIFSFQVLPVKELGKMLFKNQMTEEIKEDCSGSESEREAFKLKKDGDPYSNGSFSDSYTARITYLSHFLQIAIHEAERLPKQHVADIFTPPPNRYA